MERHENGLSGVWFALGAYGLWGVYPIYWKLLAAVPAPEIVGHRVLWCLAFLTVVLTVGRRWAWLRSLRNDPAVTRVHLGAAVLLSMNWVLYVWAVNAGYVIETALGYFINPLVNVLLGWVFLGERLRRFQAVSIALAGAGVAYLTWAYGRPPWIALGLALCFGFYGLLKKRAPLRPLEGLTLETALLALPALGFLLAVEAPRELQTQSSLLDSRLGLLLVISGVATALPLILFGAAVRRLSLTTLGTVQYLAPTLQFLMGLFLFHEPFDPDRLVGFVFIWTGIAVFVAEGFVNRNRTTLEPVRPRMRALHR